VMKAIELVEAAKKENIELRLLGACAVKIHCPKYRKLHEVALGRHATDIDLIAASKNRSKIRKLLENSGYTIIKTTVPFESRDVFNDAGGTKVDVFYDKLDMCHQIDLRNRLSVDYPTISLADLLLEKLQIVKINEKDVKDIVVIFLEHDLGDVENEIINKEYIAKILANDWGFYYTVTCNLRLIRDRFLNKWNSILSEANQIDVVKKINKLLEDIELEPKSMGWKIRASIGTKKKWYKDVEEVEKGTEFQEQLKDLLKSK
jgi:hypothetical protein